MKNLRRFLALVLVVCMLPLAAVQAHPFADVPDGCWFEESVDYVYQNGLVTAHDKGTAYITVSDGNKNAACKVSVMGIGKIVIIPPLELLESAIPISSRFLQRERSVL